MLANKKESKDKSIFAYVRELNKLHHITWHAPLIKLEKPYQNGWTKYFTLRDDYTRRDDSKAHWDILKVIGTEAFCRKQNFLDRKGKEYGPGLRVIGKNEWDGLKWPEHYKKYFVFGRWHVQHVYGWGGTVEGYKFARPFCFVEAIKPHFVTHIRTHYPEVEARIKYIHNLFEREQLWNRFNKLKGVRRFSSDYRLAKDRYLEALGTKEVEEFDKSQ
jgi:hypothetical protein